MIRMTMLALGAAAAVLTTPAFAQANPDMGRASTTSQSNAPLPTDTPPTSADRTTASEPAAAAFPQSSLKSAVRKSRTAAATSMVTTGPTEGAYRPNSGS